MAGRTVTMVLIVLAVAMQYGLWLGKGSWLRVWEIERLIAQQRAVNERLATRNAAVDAEVRDLKQGLEAVEERARSELGMIRHDEVFFRVIESPVASAANSIDPPRPH